MSRSPNPFHFAFSAFCASSSLCNFVHNAATRASRYHMTSAKRLIHQFLSARHLLASTCILCAGLMSDSSAISFSFCRRRHVAVHDRKTTLTTKTNA